MTNKKIAIIVTVAVLVLAIGVAGTFIFLSAADKEKDDDRKKDESTTLASGGDITAPDGSSQGGAQDNSIASQLLGKWRDGANMSGYEFKADGRVVLTYIDLGFIGFDVVNGDMTGVYTLEGNKLTIDTSFYAGTITISFTASVSDNTLTLVSTNNGTVFTYARAEDTDTDVGGDVNELQPGQTGIVGDWKDGAGASGFNFKDDGTVSFTYIDLQFIGYDNFAGSYDGTYIVDDDTVTIKFSIVYGVTITLNYTYEVSGSTLKMTDNNGNVTTYIRQ